MKKVIAILLSLLCAPAAAQNYLRDDGIFHSVVEGTTPGQFLTNSGGQLGGAALPTVPLTIGTSTITGGAAGRILYDNSGVLGEYTVTGTGTVAAMQNAPTFTGVVTISRNATAWAPLGTTSLHIKGADSGEARVEWTAANSDAVSVYGRLNNTFASPQPLVADDQVMGLVGEGIDTPGSTTMQQGGALGGFASQNWTPFHHGYYFRFFGINDNTIDIVNYLTLKNQMLGVVNDNPKTLLDINNNASSSPALVVATSLARVQSADASFGGMEFVSYGASPGNVLAGAIAGNTSASPAATPAGKNMLTMRGYGHNGTTWQVGGLIGIHSSNLWSGSSQGTQIDFFVTNNNSTTLTLAASITPTGGFNIGSTVASLNAFELGMNKSAAAASAPGAGTAKLAIVAGTNAGSCKLIMYAGTSSTPTTVLDNVGAGC